MQYMFRKPHHEPYHQHSHIDSFRTLEYRVFLAPPFFVTDLPFEVRWHARHLKKLKVYAEKPHKFHADHHGRDPAEFAHYFKEHVLDSIPFHDKILRDQRARLGFIRSVMSRFTYWRLHRITTKYGGCPEYFVYDKKRGEFFFVIENLNHERQHWRTLVKEKYKICDVVVLNR